MRSFIKSLTVAAVLTCGGAASAQQTTTPTTTPTATSTTSTTSIAPTTPATPPAATSAPSTTSAIVPTGSDVAPDQPTQETSTSPINRPLMVTGLILFGGTYGASAIDVAVSSRDADKNNLYYPVVGPWMDYAKRGGCPGTGSCAGETGNKVLLILDGVGQGLGAISVITSLFIPEKTTRNWYLIGNSGFHAAPSPVGTGYGFGAAGVF